MRKSRFTEAQIVDIVREYDVTVTLGRRDGKTIAIGGWIGDFR